MGESLVGQIVREYAILSIIGEGGMGAVYRARHMYLDEERAIKVIQPVFSTNKEWVERFIREARIVTRLRHPNLVLLYEFGSLESGAYFMVMELVNGESALARLQRMKRLPVHQAVRIIRQAAKGLGYAHQQGVIHRDISPDNLIITNDEAGRETTKVIDFGIAKAADEPVLTRAKTYFGKPQYGSPERIKGGETKVDHRSDIYSLGITLYHLLTGSVPFSGSSPWEVFKQHVHEPPRPPSSRFPGGDFPPRLDEIVLKSLAKEPDGRQESMQQLVRELDEVIHPEESEREDPAAVYMAQVGHEVRTRLNAIIGYSEMLEEDAGQVDNQAFVRDLRRIRAAGKHLLWFLSGNQEGGLSETVEDLRVSSPDEKTVIIKRQ